ncbi:MAG: bifunctional metallophosphatase/5'-nucleotidase [Magnetococcales bacterium]|nr:bifunctional metallophosphatase/5'-nucleotidase [Magnetococcales bacterium]
MRLLHLIKYSVVAAACITVASCQFNTQAERSNTITLLTVNDIYRIAGVDSGTRGALSRVRQIRKELEAKHPDLIVLHAGDILYPSLMSRMYDGEQMIDVLNGLDGDFEAFDARFMVTFGNHEFDKSELKHAQLLNARIAESQFDWLGTNIHFMDDAQGVSIGNNSHVKSYRMLEANGLKVGVFSVTTDVKDPAYVTAFEGHSSTARKMTAQLRKQGADLVIALTHLMVSEDKAILEELGQDGPDLIIGGHEHQKQVHTVNGRLIIKADADARTAALVTVTPQSGQAPIVDHQFLDLDQNVAVDSLVEKRTLSWQSRFDQEFCQQNESEPGCLDEQLVEAGVVIQAEELTIRRFETNIGNWFMDQARAYYQEEGAQIAFINSGSLRLNQDLASGTMITRRHLEEMFPYPNTLYLIEINGAILKEVINRSISHWTGNGWWLQISGFSFQFDPDSGNVDQLVLVTDQGTIPVTDEMKIKAVTNDFLLDANFSQDGYTMLNQSMVQKTDKSARGLKELSFEGLSALKGTIFKPQIEGRIINTKYK